MYLYIFGNMLLVYFLKIKKLSQKYVLRSGLQNK